MTSKNNRVLKVLGCFIAFVKSISKQTVELTREREEIITFFEDKVGTHSTCGEVTITMKQHCDLSYSDNFSDEMQNFSFIIDQESYELDKMYTAFNKFHFNEQFGVGRKKTLRKYDYRFK